MMSAKLFDTVGVFGKGEKLFFSHIAVRISHIVFLARLRTSLLFVALVAFSSRVSVVSPTFKIQKLHKLFSS